MLKTGTLGKLFSVRTQTTISDFHRIVCLHTGIPVSRQRLWIVRSENILYEHRVSYSVQQLAYEILMHQHLARLKRVWSHKEQSFEGDKKFYIPEEQWPTGTGNVSELEAGDDRYLHLYPDAFTKTYAPGRPEDYLDARIDFPKIYEEIGKLGTRILRFGKYTSIASKN